MSRVPRRPILIAAVVAAFAAGLFAAVLETAVAQPPCWARHGTCTTSTQTSTNTATTSQTSPFLARSKINTPIPANPPIHRDSAAMIQNNPYWLLPARSPYREWLGPRPRTVYALADRTRITVHVNYDDALGYGCDRHVYTVPVPTSVQDVLSGNGGYHDNDNNTWIAEADGATWELGYVTPPGTDSVDISCPTNQWNALRADHWTAGMAGDEIDGLGYGTNYGISASHIQIGAGLIRPQETRSTNATLGHALRINGCIGSDGTYPGHPKYVYPARGGDGIVKGAAGIPYGARIQLDPAIDVNTWPSVGDRPWLKQILRTLQVYGAIAVDHSCPPGSGGLEAANGYPWLPYEFPWQSGTGNWGYDNGVPYDLMPRFRVIDWNIWT
jgi:hypothetical protein